MASKKSAQHKQKLNFTDSELILAYDATLEAWATTLDLRHKEAKGHTLRVMEMTLSLAKAMGVSNQELVYIRYGALLHDVGNMTVPESILFKQGELTADEWVAIHMHPYNAYEMLQSISFLRPALDIPYYHHEKWDGTGYPRGLRGEQIPLAARMFSIVDVWVALTSNRPYRPAWSEDKALDYIRKQSGIHFDPKIVNLTLERGILSR
jgi:HD-GYP domain-containing protein (c-di-GMP phosphodiesterase class II)